MNFKHLSVLLFVSAMLSGCDDGTGSNDNTASGELNADQNTSAVTAVSVSGEPGSYAFSVTVRSPDQGCRQYADWWEVLSAEGDLLYRRILTHSHVTEQPFTRRGGPVNAAANTDIVVRVHMNNLGYGNQVFSGSIEQGLTQQTVDSTFAETVALEDPLPGSCAF